MSALPNRRELREKLKELNNTNKDLLDQLVGIYDQEEEFTVKPEDKEKNAHANKPEHKDQ